MREIGVGVVGFGWMGRVHTHAYARIPHHYPELAVRPVLRCVADDVPGRAARAADQFGFAGAVEDWHDLLADPTVEAVSVTAPNFLHREIGVAVAQAGKHLWIEKPLGLNAADALAVADAVAHADVRSAVGFNYRYAPAVEKARNLIAAGQLGTITHARFRLFSDYAAHPDGALSWRFERARGGSGVLGDLASHGTDLAFYLLGDLTEVCADTAIFVDTRPRPTGATSGHVRATGGEQGAVENEDYMSALLRFTSGARGVLEVSRVATSEQNNYGFEIHGTAGAVAWDFRRMGELKVSVSGPIQDQMVTTHLAGPGDPSFLPFQPGTAQPMSYDDLKVIEGANFLRSIVQGSSDGATVIDGVRSARVLEAVLASARDGRWVAPTPTAVQA